MRAHGCQRWFQVGCVAALALLTACQPAAGPSPTAPPPPPTVAPKPAATLAPTAPAPAPTAAPPAPTAAPTAGPTLAAAPKPAPAAPATPAALSGRLVVDLDADLESLDPYLAYTPAGLSVHHYL